MPHLIKFLFVLVITSIGILKLFLGHHSDRKLTSLPSISSQAAPSIDRCSDIYRYICNSKSNLDPTGQVHADKDGEKKLLEMRKDISTTKNNWHNDQIQELLMQRVFDKNRKKRIQVAFRWVQQTLEHLITLQPDSVFSREEKKQIQLRLRKIQLELPLPPSLYADEPDLLTSTDVFYERLNNGTTRLRIGGAYPLMARSWFNLVFTLAHELAHSIDPCEIRAAGLNFQTYNRLQSCFLREGLIANRTNRAECGSNDQLSETFADWIAVQITEAALRRYSAEFHSQQLYHAVQNSVRDLCEQDSVDSELDLEFHPSPEIRIGKIFGLNPSIRRLLDCTPSSRFNTYCTFDQM